ncbi:MAG: hypothetical protein ABIJ92_04715 [Candidatus Aenigmatarchaeota archaeon]
MTIYAMCEMSENGNRVKVLLTPEEFSQPEFRTRGSQWDIGFLPKERVPAHYCKKCDTYHEEPPKIEVLIGERGDRLSTLVEYKCVGCDSNLVLNHLESPDGIPIEYIIWDTTGDWKAPTTIGIEDELRRAKRFAEEGNGGYRDCLNQASRWAEKIGYEIDPEITPRLEEVQRAVYSRKFEVELPELINNIIERDWAFNLDEDEDISVFEGSGLSGIMDYLLDTLPQINLPESVELRQSVLRVLYAYRDMFRVDILRAREDREASDRLQWTLKGVRGANQMIGSYISRAELTADQINEANDSPIGYATLAEDFWSDTG